MIELSIGLAIAGSATKCTKSKMFSLIQFIILGWPDEDWDDVNWPKNADARLNSLPFKKTVAGTSTMVLECSGHGYQLNLVHQSLTSLT